MKQGSKNISIKLNVKECRDDSARNKCSSGGSRGGSRGAMEPPFGRVLRNYEGFVVVLRVIGALAIVYVYQR